MSDTTRAAQDIDADEAFAAVRAAQAHHLDFNAAHEVAKSVVSYAAQTLCAATGLLCFQAHQMPAGTRLVGGNGWVGTPEPCPTPHNLYMLLHRPGLPGGYLVWVRYTRLFTPEAKAAERDVDNQISALYEAAGHKHFVQLMDDVCGKRTIDTPLWDHLQALRQDPRSYLPLAADTPVERIEIIAVDLTGLDRGGPLPAGPLPYLENQDTQEAHLCIGQPAPDNTSYSPGTSATLSPSSMPSYKSPLDCSISKRSHREGAMPERALEALSGLLAANGMATQVAFANAEVRTHAWDTSNVAHFPLLEEAGHAGVDAGEGLVTATLCARIESLSRDTTALLIGAHVQDFCALAQMLPPTTVDGPYACNDGRDIAHLTHTPDGFVLHTRTQNGAYQMHIRTDGAGQAVSITARENTRGPIGRFQRVGTDWVACYDAQDGEPAIPYTIRAVRDMNGAISSLSSVHANLCADENA